MEADFPAAHSMDAIWFAVDSVGQVAMFDTGETGPLPRRLEENDIREQLWQLWRPGEEKDDRWDTDWLCSELGVYYFVHRDEYDTEQPIGLYHRSIKPDLPLHIDQLPPDLRYLCQEISCDLPRTLRFDRMERFQPLEFLRCEAWDRDSVAYLCADGKTVKPIPGREERFAGFVREFRQHNTRAAESLTFDGPTE
jgi:hypothetical protein